MLERVNLYHESPELKAEYLAGDTIFRKYVGQYNKQFWGTGTGLSNRGYRTKSTLVTPDGRPVHLVNDGEIQESKHTSGKVKSNFWSRAKEDDFSNDGEIYTLPTHPYVYCYNLDAYHNVWVHALDMVPYEYDPSLKDKLILPRKIRGIIDVLTADMDVLMEDIIKGKTGGTIILCKGAPGTGKTLTAEAYAEIIQRPLYKVQSSQLGISLETLEAKLKEALERASRWGAVLLIDEADVYVRERGDDMHQNAVVGVFLRTLEYYNGLLFLTTNRSSLIDDAIVSRCTAILQYTAPTEDDAKAIWRVLATQFGVTLSEEFLTEVVEQFPGISGRSIKALLKLMIKWDKKHSSGMTLETAVELSHYLELT